jgi:D-apiose dehydrogenase
MIIQELGSRPLNVALAGAGMISWHHLTAWRKLGAQIKLVAICDPDKTRAKERAQEFSIPSVYTSADDMFAAETIDVIDIATPRASHASLIEASASRGVAILCQKPLTPTLMEAEALMNKLRMGAKLMVHENWRFRPWYRELKQWILAGDLGTIRHAQISVIDSGLLVNAAGHRPHLKRQPFLAHESRLMITEGLIHHLDVMRFLCGSLRVVSALALRTDPEIKGETVATIMLETPTGVAVLVHGSMVAPGFPESSEDRLLIIGSKASVELSNGELRLLGTEPRTRKYDPAEGYQASFDGAIAHFVSRLRPARPFETSLEDNIETLRLVEHAYWAAGLHATR